MTTTFLLYSDGPNQKRYNLSSLGIFLSSLVLLIFISPASAVASCGSFVTPDGYRDPVEDCSNPFAVSTTSNFSSVQYEYASTSLINDSIIQVESLPAELKIGINTLPGQYDTFTQLVKHENGDYLVLASNFRGPYSGQFSATGTYSFITDVYVPLDEFAYASTWLEKAKRFFIATADAQIMIFPFKIERVALTFSIEEVSPTPVGASSVLFLPGIQASRLYKDGLLGTEDQLWEPNFNQDVAQLDMTETGESVNEIYTKDIIDEALGTVPIYAGFISFMDDLVATEKIKAWEPFAYDWRYSVFSVVQDGTAYQPGRKSLKTILMELAENSFSGKVTIVAHSNGGLLAKALLIEYPELAPLIDKIIFLGTPQLGTPTAIAALLHGYDQARLGGALVSANTSRFATQNMPGAYGLLPGQAYFAAQKDLVFTFDTSDETKIFRDAYGNAINFESELQDFLIGREGRSQPERISDASLANESLLNEVFTYRKNLLDAWRAPEGIKIIEVVGVGLDTESGFEYTKFSERICTEPDLFGSQTCKTENFYKPIPWISQYGDETVMALSAEGYEGEKTTYYFDLKSSRDDQLKYTHSSITESESVHTLINKILDSDTEDLNISYLNTQASTYYSNRAMISTHSPVNLVITDELGNQTGLVEGKIVEDIPGSSYRTLAGSEYVIVPEGVPYDISIEAYHEGGMTFMVHALNGEEQSMIIRTPIPIIASTTKITLSSQGGLATSSFSNLSVDWEGDGVIDTTLTLLGDEVLSVPEVVTYNDLIETIQALHLKKNEKKVLLAIVKVAERLSERNTEVTNRLESFFLQKLSLAIRLLKQKGRISDEEYSNLKVIINHLMK